VQLSGLRVQHKREPFLLSGQIPRSHPTKEHRSSVGVMVAKKDELSKITFIIGEDNTALFGLQASDARPLRRAFVNKPTASAATGTPPWVTDRRRPPLPRPAPRG
jgi:hypothetical protein